MSDLFSSAGALLRAPSFAEAVVQVRHAFVAELHAGSVGTDPVDSFTTSTGGATGNTRAAFAQLQRAYPAIVAVAAAAVAMENIGSPIDTTALDTFSL